MNADGKPLSPSRSVHLRNPYVPLMSSLPQQVYAFTPKGFGQLGWGGHAGELMSCPGDSDVPVSALAGLRPGMFFLHSIVGCVDA